MTPWVLIAGDFVRSGGMDRANLELAEYLCSIGYRVHLVSFRVDPELAANPMITLHLEHRTLGSHLLNSGRLNHRGRRVAGAVSKQYPGTRVLVNGTNCDWPDLNWIHFVHHAWAGQANNAPLWYKVKNAVGHWRDCRHEQRILPRARALIANSEQTRRDLVQRVGVEDTRVHRIYLGANDDWKTISPARRLRVRAHYGIRQERPLVIFVGAMGYDDRKGYKTLWSAWKALCTDPAWDGELIVAGDGRALPAWKKAAAEADLLQRTKLIGFAPNVPDLLAAADLLVSPVRYESYGLNVQEALTCGVPAIVSASAGVAERYSPELKELLLMNSDDASELVSRMHNWRNQLKAFQQRAEQLASSMRSYTWSDMAEQIVKLAEKVPRMDLPGL